MSLTDAPMLAVLVPLEGAARVVSMNVGSDADVLRLVDWIGRDADDRADLVVDFLVAMRALDRAEDAL